VVSLNPVSGLGRALTANGFDTLQAVKMHQETITVNMFNWTDMHLQTQHNKTCHLVYAKIQDRHRPV